MRYNRIRKMDISNGPGVRVSIFMQGCTFNCEGCFNKETHSFDGGNEFNNDVIDEIIELAKPDYIKGLSILGGEPLHAKNIEGTIMLAKKFKEVYPNKSIWLWSGFTFDKVINKEIFNYIDTMIDGQFKIGLSSPLLKYKGSSNQRVIDIKKTLEKNEIVLWED